MGFTNEFQIRFSISYINTVSATGGTAGADGSDGRIAIYYSSSFSGTANNAYLRNMSEEQVDSIFLDGFESGDLSAWSSAQTDGGDLMTSQSGDYWGDYGLAASINDTNAIYVQDDTPDGEGTFHTRFYINPDGLNMGAADILPIFQGLDSDGSPVMKVEINNPSGSAFQVRVNVLEGSTWVPGAWQNLPGGWTAIELDYKTTHELGFIKLYINGMEAGSVNNINNPDNQLHSVRLGAVTIPSGTTSGVLYLDDYESRRYSTIGLLPDRGGEDPEAVQEAGWAERVYSYQRSQPFAVQQVTTEEGTSTYDYDANGNMITRMENGVSWTHTYNAENRLASLANGVTTWLFSYDGDGTLVGQLVTDNVTATHTAFFMGGGYEVISDGVTETVRKYYALSGSTFGMSDNGVMKYLISDHLGSSVAVTDITGNVLAETRFMPFGEPRADVGSITQTDKTFTGQRDVPDTGLMDYRARMYSPYLNRWTQPDTIIPNITNPQDWNRYTYSRNNPIKYVDPSGHMPTDGCNYEGCQEYATAEDNYQIIQEALFENPRGWKDLTKQYKDIISKGGVTQDYYEKTEMAGTPGVQNAKWYEDPAAWIAITFVVFKQAPTAVVAIGQYFCLDGDCGNEIKTIDAVFPKNPSQLMHIFRYAAGHLYEDNLMNRDLLLRTVSPDNFKKIDEFGTLVFARLLANGAEVWVYVRDGIIQNGGVNPIPFWH